MCIRDSFLRIPKGFSRDSLSIAQRLPGPGEALAHQGAPPPHCKGAHLPGPGESLAHEARE
eukprot:4742162-Pyramimonas_sp.AAC.1